MVLKIFSDILGIHIKFLVLPTIYTIFFVIILVNRTFWCHGTSKAIGVVDIYLLFKLVGVAPLMTDPPPTRKKRITSYIN